MLLCPWVFYIVCNVLIITSVEYMVTSVEYIVASVEYMPMVNLNQAYFVCVFFKKLGISIKDNLDHKQQTVVDRKKQVLVTKIFFIETIFPK